MSTYLYLLLSIDETTIIDRFEVSQKVHAPRFEAEKHWIDKLEAGHKICTIMDTNKHDIRKARAALDREKKMKG